jgi:hypothetical protein
MLIVLNKVLKALLFGRWMLLSLYTIYKFTYLQNSLWRNFFFWQTVHLNVIFEFTLVAHITHSHIHSRMPSFKTVHDAQTNITLAQKYIVLPLLFFSVHTRERRFPFEGQCWECFTSRWLIWDTDGLGLPRDTPLAVTFCSWDSVIKLRTRTSLKLLCHFITCFM